MIELILLLATIGIASKVANNTESVSKTDNSSKKKEKNIGESLKQDSLYLPSQSIPLKRSITFQSFSSGYDPARDIWWTRRDKWEVGEL